MEKFLLPLFFLFFFFQFLLPSAYASDTFDTRYQATYIVSDDQTTHVVFTITLTNKSSEFYSPTHTVHLGFTDVKNVLAKDQKGQLTPIIEKFENGYAITTTFNNPAAGRGKSTSYTLSFDTDTITQRQANVREIAIAGIPKNNDFLSYDTQLKVPKSFGEPSYVKPTTFKETEEKNYIVYSYAKEQLEKSGISIGFGTKQTYQFALHYHLKNTNIFPITATIALPPTTNYQQVFLTDIQSRPINVIQDIDGNWIASYKLFPAERKDITVTGYVIVSLHPQKEDVSKEQRELYLQPSAYWQTNDTEIQTLALSLKTPEAIYKHVVKTLQYDVSRIKNGSPRLGASAVLANPQSAVCLEFTDLFVALARAAGIPARAVEGYAKTNNNGERPLSLVKDVLHAWPEYYDDTKQMWIMVDPTWENTTRGIDYFQTLDVNHITFVRKGMTSTQPIPAGNYKINSENSQDVTIHSINKPIDEKRSFSFSGDVASHMLSFLPLSGEAIIYNTGNIRAKPMNLVVTADTFILQKQSLEFSQIPPFGHQTQSFSFPIHDILTKRQDIITMTFDKHVLRKTVQVSPIPLQQYITGGEFFVGICIILISILAIITWRLSVSKHRR